MYANTTNILFQPFAEYTDQEFAPGLAIDAEIALDLGACGPQNITIYWHKLEVCKTQLFEGAVNMYAVVPVGFVHRDNGIHRNVVPQ